MKCRHCRATVQSSDFHGSGIKKQYLYKCQTGICGRFFWHRRVLREFDLNAPSSPENKIREQYLCEVLNIPTNLNQRSVYVIKLSRGEDEYTATVYVEETAHHPLRRYLQHLRGYKSGRKHVENRGKYLLSYEEGFKSIEDSRNREKELANELGEDYLVVGGH